MDEISRDLILSRLDDVREDYKENQSKLENVRTDVGKVRDDVREIRGSIVGQERCTQIMGQLATQIQALNSQVQDVKQVCTRNETDKYAIAKYHEELVKRVDNLELDIEPRMKCLENQKIIVDYQQGLVGLGWKAITSSPILGGIMTLLVAIVTGVYWDKVADLITRWGIHAVLLSILIIGMGAVSAWVTRRRAKKALQKIGVIHALIVLMLLSSPVLAQENDTDGVTRVMESKPLVIPDLMKANIILSDVLAEELCWMTGAKAFLGNDSLNLTNSNLFTA